MGTVWVDVDQLLGAAEDFRAAAARLDLLPLGLSAEHSSSVAGSLGRLSRAEDACRNRYRQALLDIDVAISGLVSNACEADR